MTRTAQKTPNLESNMQSFFTSNFLRRSAAIVFILGIFVMSLLSNNPSSAIGLTNNKQKASANSEKERRFTIEAMSAYVVGNTSLNLTIQTEATTGQIKIEVLSPTNTRSGLFAFSQKQSNKRSRSSITFLISQLVPVAGKPGFYDVSIPVNSDAQPSLAFSATGIYPIAVTLTDTEFPDQTNYSFTTYIPTVGANGAAYAQRLKVVPLVSFAPTIDRINVIEANGKLTSSGSKVLSELLVKQQSIDALTKISAPFSIILSPELFDTFNSLQKATSRQNSAVPFISPPQNDKIEFIADTYVPTNIAELEKQDVASAYPDLLTLGRSKIKSAGFSAPVRTLVTGEISDNSIDLLTRSGIDQVIVRDDTFNKKDLPENKPALLTNGTSSLRVASSNSSILENMPKGLSLSAQANYLVGATSVVALEKPSVERGFIVPLDLANLDGQVVSTFIHSLTNSPLVESTTTNKFFQSLSSDKNIGQKLSKADFPKNVATPFTQEDLKSIGKYSTATQSMFSSDTEIFRQAQWQQFARFSDSNRKISRYLTATKARDLTQSVKNYIALPEKRTLTITSRENEIPVTIRNTFGKPISIVINISSDKLAFPEGRTFPVDLDEQNSTIKIPVRARTSGSFPVTISVSTPTNSIEIAQQEATVRSTVFSGAGIAIAVSSLVFLAIWWASHYRRNRKKPIAPIIEIG